MMSHHFFSELTVRGFLLILQIILVFNDVVRSTVVGDVRTIESACMYECLCLYCESNKKSKKNLLHSIIIIVNRDKQEEVKNRQKWETGRAYKNRSFSRLMISYLTFSELIVCQFLLIYSSTLKGKLDQRSPVVSNFLCHLLVVFVKFSSLDLVSQTVIFSISVFSISVPPLARSNRGGA